MQYLDMLTYIIMYRETFTKCCFNRKISKEMDEVVLNHDYV
jgi:hypothetical protein